MSRATAIVIGAGPGLGAALLRRLAAESFTVVAAARDLGRLQSLVEREVPSTSMHAHRCDVTVPGDVDALFSEVQSEHGAPELVVFNVGSLERGRVVELDAISFESAWRSICLGGFLVGQAAARLMLEAGRGTFIFTGATSALRGKAGFSAPASARAGLRAVAQSMARELGPSGIHVAHVIIDGGIYRPEYKERLAGRPEDSLLDPDAIADAYLAIHRQHRSAWTQELDLRPYIETF